MKIGSGYTADDVLKYEDEFDLYGGIPSHIRSKILVFPNWKLTHVPLEMIHNHSKPVTEPMKGEYFGESDEEIAQEYSRLKTDFPAVVVIPSGSHYLVIEGAHRSRAAFLKGQGSILAFVPVQE